MADLERELLYRLLTFNSGVYGVRETIRVSELPPGFPVMLPSEVKVLGSLEQRFPPRPEVGQSMQMVRNNHTRVMVDTTLAPAAFMVRLREHLATEWQDAPWPPHQMGGFVSRTLHEHLSLYNPVLELALHVEALEVGNVTQAALSFQSQSTADIERMSVHRHMQEAQFAVRVPDGVTVYPGGSGGGGGQWNFSATLETDLSVTALLDALSQELAARSWVEQTRNVAQSAASINWTGEEGVVLVTLKPIESGFVAQMMVSQTGGMQNTGSSGFSF